MQCIEKLLSEIDSYTQLEYGWDDGGGVPMTVRTANAAKRFIKELADCGKELPFLSPDLDGSFTVHFGGFSDPGAAEVYILEDEIGLCVRSEIRWEPRGEFYFGDDTNFAIPKEVLEAIPDKKNV